MSLLKRTLVLVVIGALVCPAMADVLIDQNFDSFATGTLPFTPTAIGSSADASGAWTGAFVDGSNASIDNSQSYSANNSLNITRTSYGHGRAIGYTDTFFNTGKVEASFMAYRASSTSSVFVALGAHSYSVGSGMWEYCSVFIAGNGEIGVTDSSEPAAYDYVSGVATPSETWMKFKLAVDIDAMVYDLYYSADGSDAGLTKIYEGATIEAWSYYTDSIAFDPVYNGGTCYIDDVKLEIVPEPATMSLLALGGLAMLRRRK